MTLLAGATLTGYQLLSTASASDFTDTTPHATGYWQAVFHIVQTNIPTALSLFSGVITCGISSLFIIAMVGLFLGASVNVSVGMYGWQDVVAKTALYTPFEVGGFVLAGAAGLIPLVTLAWFLLHGSEKTSSGVVRLYRDSLLVSLRWFGMSIGVLLIAALLEGFSVASL